MLFLGCLNDFKILTCLLDSWNPDPGSDIRYIMRRIHTKRWLETRPVENVFHVYRDFLRHVVWCWLETLDAGCADRKRQIWHLAFVSQENGSSFASSLNGCRANVAPQPLSTPRGPLSPLEENICNWIFHLRTYSAVSISLLRAAVRSGLVYVSMHAYSATANQPVHLTTFPMSCTSVFQVHSPIGFQNMATSLFLVFFCFF